MEPSAAFWRLPPSHPSPIMITTATIPAGAWTHVAFTKDVNDSGSGGVGSNTSALKFYKNGSLVESSDISQPGPTTGEVATLLALADQRLFIFWWRNRRSAHL